MNFRNLILSDEKKYVVVRHLLFWMVYGTLFHIQNNSRSLLYIGCFLPACVTIVYSLLYAVLPLLQKKRYALALAAAMVTYVASLALNLIGSYIFFQVWKDGAPDKMIPGLALHNHILALCIGVVAFGLKATKSRYLKQVEHFVLVKLKAENDLNLEKANLYPEFVLQSLKCLQDKVVKGTADSGDLLLKLSDTLSYILYDSQVELIDLEKELAMVRNIIMFKSIQWPSCDIQFVTNGIPANQQIAPLALFRMVEKFFRCVGVEMNTPTEADMTINIDGESLNFNAFILYSASRLGKNEFERIADNMKKQVNDVYADGLISNDSETAQYSVSFVLHLTKPVELSHITIDQNVLA